MSARAALAIVASSCALAACTRPAPVAPPSPTPTPPPELAAGEPPVTRADGAVEYHLVVRANSGTIFLPVSVDAEHGKGRVDWVRPSATKYRYDAARDAWTPGDGEVVDEYVDAVFPASPQSLAVPVVYEGTPPAAETLHFHYRTMEIRDLAMRAYVGAKVGAREKGSTDERHPLGERLRGVDVARWLASGFLVREPGPLSEATIELAGPGA